MSIVFLIILGMLIYNAIRHIQSTNEWKEKRLAHRRPLPIHEISSPIPMSRNPYLSRV